MLALYSASPGQGIQSAGMGLDERTKSKAVDEVWRRADAHTRSAMGFSILAIVRDNPTEIVARGVTYRHPEGVLNLTQFTQVALATLAIGQTARMREEGVLVPGAAFAGHTLGQPGNAFTKPGHTLGQTGYTYAKACCANTVCGLRPDESERCASQWHGLSGHFHPYHA